MRQVVRRLALGALATAVVAYAALLVLLKSRERELVYASAYGTLRPPFDTAMHAVRLPSTDGVTLEALALAPLHPDDRTAWVLLLHGNGSTSWDSVGQHHAQLLHRLGFGVLAPDYRGFGRSTGAPSEAGLYDDGVAAFRFLTDSLRVPAGRILLVGHSLGSGVATELATRVPAGGLALVGAFASVSSVAAMRYPYVPVRLMLAERFENAAKLPRVRMPVAIVHAADDDVVPIVNGEALYAAAPQPKRFYRVRGGHVEGGFSPDALGEALEWIRLQPPPAPSFALR